MNRGRPKRYENQADKQKAYRERKKVQTPALRKSAVAYWTEKVAEIEALHKQHRLNFPRYEDEYPGWAKEARRLYELWDEAHEKSYYLRCYENDWFISEGVRVKFLPLIKIWLEDFDNEKH